MLGVTWHKTQVFPDLEDYTTQVSKEIEGRVTKRLSMDLSRSESRILGALSRLDEFLLNPLIQGDSGSPPETSRNTLGTNQGTNEDDTHSNPHHETSISQSQITWNFGPEDSYDRYFMFMNAFLTLCENETRNSVKYICFLAAKFLCELLKSVLDVTEKKRYMFSFSVLKLAYVSKQNVKTFQQFHASAYNHRKF